MGATMPHALPVIDGLIAATAQDFGLVVVGRNPADFDREGVSVWVANPFG
jgi:predicted nucleic acid-binding protein